MKFVCCCLLLLAVIALSQAYSASWGQRNATSVLLLRQSEVYPAKKNKEVNVEVKYPYSGKGSYYIAGIYVYDNFRNNSGAVPSIKSGGVGHRNVKIKLRGKISQGINSTVEIWGRH